MNRRHFINALLALGACSLHAQSRRAPRLLLCSAWQVVNIGDIAHTPGALALIETYLPEAEVTLWLFNPLTTEARELMMRRFPRLKIVEGSVNADFTVDSTEAVAAMDRSDFLLHGSGPATLAWRHAEAFMRRTGRGFGVQGVTYGLYGKPERETLSKARFLFFRDSVSLELARQDGVRAPVMGFGPDTAFGTDLRDDARADAFLKANDLWPGQFLCCISRYRYTPFWDMPSKATPFNAERHARNQDMKERDHAPLLEAITSVIRETSLKILLCPEDESQMRITRENLYDRLPSELRARVVWRETFWLPDEAISVYRRSAGLFGHEMHSPIMCIGHGVPAIVCRWEEQSSKGIMWRDLGLGDWLFDLDVPQQAAGVAPAVLALARDPVAARARAAEARTRVHEYFKANFATLAAELPG